MYGLGLALSTVVCLRGGSENCICDPHDDFFYYYDPVTDIMVVRNDQPSGSFRYWVEDQGPGGGGSWTGTYDATWSSVFWVGAVGTIALLAEALR